MTDKKKLLKTFMAKQVTDYTPFSAWTHYPEIDREPQAISQATYDFARQFDLDFIKTMSNGMYTVEDYGVDLDFSAIAKGGVAQVKATPIHYYQDWREVPELSVGQAPAFQRELEHLERLVELTKGEIPLVVTVHSPLTTANKLCQGQIDQYIEADGEGYLLQALERLTRPTIEFVQLALSKGADGIYLASQMASHDKLSPQTYQKYGIPFDLKIIEAAESGWLNTLHIHGANIMFDLLKDYPLPIINWHIGESKPELEEGIQETDKFIMGGLRREAITQADWPTLKDQLAQAKAINQTDNRILLTPGCVIRQPFSEETLARLRDLIRS
ncbi:MULTISPECIES: uroporphyrinogen decarboxylase family protein [Aerococcus]|uniref:Uroporphyrinogen decarboxylase n=1 Tax=Aerococcus tenax TaxID=3078812 RepID=A0A5N1BQ05_9LACT|nr:uroporphyrinogen decarboxylase family protein [Aerococcus urinae]KAA9240641.1 uroporphyrinogen decarboxylase [Aerococcus urinae]MDK7802176.1 uroporphyrinogen decarboxylase family protein [Aerococcus urinae]MDK8655762.1 uroporphyrinogen decarboxylase family protein [Aerococcus urinae]